MLSRKYYKKLAEIFKNGYIESYKHTLENDPNMTNNIIVIISNVFILFNI